jgi:DNA polymerase-3 subunit chi
MPRADFYLIAKPRFRDEPLRLVCELARRCHDSGEGTLILARDAAQAEALDELLWEFDEEAYVAHQVAGQDEDDDATPVLIVPPGVAVAVRPMVINLRDEVAPAGFERVLEVVPADPAAREPLRLRWSRYKALGLELAKHDM